jgi:excisionase family DNA binding protein
MSANVTSSRILRSNWGIGARSNGRRLRPVPTQDEYAGESNYGAGEDGPGYDAFTRTAPAVAIPATTGKTKTKTTASLGLAHHSHATRANAEEAGSVHCEPLIDAERAAQLLKLHPKTVKRLVQKGRLPGFRIGRVWRFRESSLDVWMRSQLDRLDRSPAPPIP